jgi:hypothetical protein
MVINCLLNKGNFSRLNIRIQNSIGEAIIFRALYKMDLRKRFIESVDERVPLEEIVPPKIEWRELEKELMKERETLLEQTDLLREEYSPRELSDLPASDMKRVFFRNNEATAIGHAMSMLQDPKVWGKAWRRFCQPRRK